MRLAVGATGDDGALGGTASAGAVHLFTFADTAFATPTLARTLGVDYAGANGVPTLDSGDLFGSAVALRGGFLNLGGEGQLVLGGLASALAALYLPLPAPLLLPAALLAGALGGGAWALLARGLELRFGVPLLIGTLLLNYPARYLASYVVNHPLRDVASGMSQTVRVPEAIELPRLAAGARLHAGALVVLALVLAAAWIVRRTRAGYELRMTGENPAFARYGGVDVERLGWGAMLASGGVAGLVGALEVLGTHRRFIDGALTDPLYAWTGLMAALLAVSSPLGVLAAGLFFAAVHTGGFGMERGAEVPRELSQVLQALMILLIAARASFHFRAPEAKPS